MFGASSPSKKEGAKISTLKILEADQVWYEEDTTRGNDLSNRVLEFVSARPGDVHEVCDRLVAALSSGCKEKKASEIKLAGRAFESRADLKAECRNIMKRHPEDGAVLNPEDESMVRELLQFHPKGAQKANGCTSMEVGLHPVWGTRCLYVVRGKDGEREDFSYARCCDAVPTQEIHAQQRICQTLCGVIRLHPTIVEPLARIIEDRFPLRFSMKHSVEKHRNWMLSLLQLSVSLSVMSGFLINLLIRKMIEIDMHISKKEEERNPCDEDVEEEDIDKMAQILDAMMMLMFEFLQRFLPIGGVITAEERDLVALFMGIFETTVLPTHRTRCVQFLFFYIACCRPNWTEDFLGKVLGITYSPQHAVPTRLLSAAYCASYAARARNAGVKFSFPTMTYLVGFAREMQQDAEARVASGEHNHTQVTLFLQAVQAVCYILCFKTAAFAQEPETKGPLERLLRPWGSEQTENGKAFTPILESPIRPIALINRNVAKQFCRSMKRLFPSVSTHCRQLLRQNKAGAKNRYYTGDTVAMESFFPFDPYRLRHSHIFVRGMYQEWTPQEESEDEDEDSETEEAAGFEAESDAPGKRAVGVSEDDESDADFTDNVQAEERGFIPSVGPSPAFRPQPSVQMGDMSPMTPLCMSVDAGDEIDSFTLPTPMLAEESVNSVLAQMMNSRAYGVSA